MSTYSPILRTELIGDGQQPGAWGATTNLNFQYIFEAAIAGYVAVTVTPTANNQVLTYTNGPSSNAALDQTVYGILKLNTGTLGANFNVFAPPVSKTYIVWNNTSYSATFYNSTVIGNTTAAGSGITVAPGYKTQIWSDGTNFWGNDATTGNLQVFGSLGVSVNAAVGGNLTVTGTSTFTGIPTGPTAAAGTNTTQLATTAFVTTAVANAFPSGTRLVFAQAAAPTGWTQDTSDTANNRMMRVVNTTGGGVGGSSDPTLMNVVPSHTHGWSANTNTVDINHYHSGTTGGQSANHTHNGTTDGMNANNPHSHGTGQRLAPFTGPSPGFAGGSNYAPTDVQSGTDLNDINHGHTFTTGGVSVDHNHNFDTGYMSANNTHYHSVSGTTDNGSSQTNWTPRYNNVIICQKN